MAHGYDAITRAYYYNIYVVWMGGAGGFGIWVANGSRVSL